MRLNEVLKPLLENKVDYLADNMGDKILNRIRRDHTVYVLVHYETDRGSVQHESKNFQEIIEQFTEKHGHDLNITIEPYTNDAPHIHSETVYHIEDLSRMILTTLKDHIDPTNGKYLQWITKMYINGEFLLYEDMETLSTLLTTFSNHKRGMEKKDINQYKSLSELSKATRKFIETGTDSTIEQRFLANGEAEIVFNDDEHTIIIPKTEEASRYYTKEKFATEWCTAYPDHFNEYSSVGSLYMIIPKDESNEVYQVHFESNSEGTIHDMDFDYQPWQVKDIDDEEIHNRKAFYDSNTAFAWLVDNRIHNKMGLNPEDLDINYHFYELYYAVDKKLAAPNMFVEFFNEYPDHAIPLISEVFSRFGHLNLISEFGLSASDILHGISEISLTQTNHSMSINENDPTTYTFTLPSYTDLDNYIGISSELMRDSYEFTDFLDGTFVENTATDYNIEREIYDSPHLLYENDDMKQQKKLIGLIASAIKKTIFSDDETIEELGELANREETTFYDFIHDLVNNQRFFDEGEVTAVLSTMEEVYFDCFVEEHSKEIKEQTIHDLEYRADIKLPNDVVNSREKALTFEVQSADVAIRFAFLDTGNMDEEKAILINTRFESILDFMEPPSIKTFYEELREKLRGSF